ncbi:MAG: DUF3990 domain-containing protein [Synergistaceae bacterium]|nr:DUF3990 domain-containing protein [Synergistaceae bacterium]
MSQTIKLYHGSIHDFNEIDLSRGKPFKDFGRGFYTTRNRDHAVGIAYRNREILLSRLQEAGIKSDVKRWLYTYTDKATAYLKQIRKEEIR